MSKEEFMNYLKGEKIEGKFVKGKACFLEENVPAREKEEAKQEISKIIKEKNNLHQNR